MSERSRFLVVDDEKTIRAVIGRIRQAMEEYAFDVALTELADLYALFSPSGA